VTEARRIVACQEERIARLGAAGCSTLDAEQTLDVCARTLRLLKDRERMLRAERLAGKRPPKKMKFRNYLRLAPPREARVRVV
jgi:hypothetical protein